MKRCQGSQGERRPSGRPAGEYPGHSVLAPKTLSPQSALRSYKGDCAKRSCKPRHPLTLPDLALNCRLGQPSLRQRRVLPAPHRVRTGSSTLQRLHRPPGNATVERPEDGRGAEPRRLGSGRTFRSLSVLTGSPPGSWTDFKPFADLGSGSC